MKLKELIPGFIQNCERLGLKPASIYTHSVVIRKVILPVLGEFEITELLPIHRSLLIEKARPMGVSMAQKSIVTFRRILTYGRECGIRTTFHIDELESAKYHRVKPVESLTMQDIETIRTYLSAELKPSKHASKRLVEGQKMSNARCLCFFEFLLHTGLRLSEALAVDISDLNWSQSSIKIRNEKTFEWRTVYFYGAEEAIKKYLSIRTDKNPALFVSNEGKRFCYIAAQSCLKKLKKRVNLGKNLTHHIFRKTFVTTLLRAKVDPKEAQLMAGHASLRTTLDHYYEVDLEKLQPIHKRVIGNL